MPLLLVQSFVNTYEADTGVDLLADPGAGLPWLKEAGLLDSESVTSDELEQTRRVREGLRALLVHNAGGEMPSGRSVWRQNYVLRAPDFRAKRGHGARSSRNRSGVDSPV